MYTGIVEQTGTISALLDSAEGRRLQIQLATPMTDLKLGDSINISGCCFTIVDLGSNNFTVQASHETLRCSKIGLLQKNSEVNLERPMKFEDRIGGHLVSGHVDTTATVKSIKQEGFSKLITFELGLDYAPYFVDKGSVTIDGVSLTVVQVQIVDKILQFSVALIPYTMEVTTFGDLQVGETVNIETDLIAKYLARWLSLGNQMNLAKLIDSINAGQTATNSLVTREEARQ